MWKVYLILITSVLAGACSKTKSKDCNSVEKTYSFSENAKVDTSRNSQYFFATVSSGSKLVFKYQEKINSCPDIADGGSSFLLIFEADPSVSSFTYATSDLQNANVYSSLICGECPQLARNSSVPASGTITGVRFSATSWQVNFDVQTNFHGHRTGSAIFRKE